MFARFIILLLCHFAFTSVIWVASLPEAKADGHFNMIWTYDQYTDAGNRGRMTSTVFIGVPETDNSMGYGSCFAGSTAGLPVLELAADTTGFGTNQPVDIEFFSDSGPMLYSGVVKSALSEEDYNGVRLELDINDPLWSVFRRMDEISYRVNGRMIDLSLRGSSRAISNFLADCAIYNPGAEGLRNTGPANSPQATSDQAFDPRWATCDTFSNNVSIHSDVPVSVTFVNRSDGYRSVMWIAFDGTPTHYADLDPGQSFAINTYVTHPWMFTDGPGNCLEMFMPQPGIPIFNISAPNRDFGPE